MVWFRFKRELGILEMGIGLSWVGLFIQGIMNAVVGN